jgi:hypothetical protein
MTTATEVKHVWTHPRDREVLGVKLRELSSDLERRLVRSLAAEPKTAPVWPVLKAIGATDGQIDGVLRFPGLRRVELAGGYKEPIQVWHWRAEHETQWWVDNKLTLAGDELLGMVRRVLSIPALEGGDVAAPAAIVPTVDSAYAELARQHQKPVPATCPECGGSGEIDWICSHCNGTGQEHVPLLGRECHLCDGAGGGCCPCEVCAAADDEAEPEANAEPEAKPPGRGWHVLASPPSQSEGAADVLVEGLASRAEAEAWLLERHEAMTASHGYAEFFVDGDSDDAAWDAAEGWYYRRPGGPLYSCKTGLCLLIRVQGGER